MTAGQPIPELLALLQPRRRVQLSFTLMLMVLSGAAEAISLAAVMPFLWVLTNPQELWEWSLVQRFVPLLGADEPRDLLLPAALLFSGAVLAASLIRLANIWVSTRLAAAIGSDLSTDAFHRSIYQPYSMHLSRNSSVLIASMTSQLELTVLALNQFLQLVSAVIVLVGLLICLFVVDWRVALLAGVTASIIYGVIAGLARNSLLRNGEHIHESQVVQVRILRESFGAIRDVILNGTQRFFFESYQRVDRPMRRRQAQNQFLGLYPRYAVEAVAMVSIAGLAYILVSQRGADQVVPLLGVFALAAQRLMPAIQLIYTAWTDIRSKSPAAHAVLDILSQPIPQAFAADVTPLNLLNEISFDRVGFSYAEHDTPIVQDVSFRIARGQRVGIVGSTGSGKSTTLDLLMGLQAPTAGRISIDGVDLYDVRHPERLLAWRAAIAHVPQNVYLADSSFSANIAFGVPAERIDMSRVRHAALQAQIAGYIESLPSGYDSTVGERGVRISGGQRQRIGIARALYRRAQVLVFDEATNALDSVTEQAVVEAIESLGRDLTIIVVAHRLATLKNCDQIVELGGGAVQRIGTYQSVLERHA